MTEPDEFHLSQHTLTEDGIGDVLEELNVFLADAPFEQDKKGLEYCSDERLKDAARPIFPALGTLIQDKINSKHMQCNVLRLHPGTTPLTSRSTADLIPVKVWGSNPTIDGMELATGSVTHITKGVKVQVEEGSMLDLLFLVEKNEKEGKKK